MKNLKINLIFIIVLNSCFPLEDDRPLVIKDVGQEVNINLRARRASAKVTLHNDTIFSLDSFEFELINYKLSQSSDSVFCKLILGVGSIPSLNSGSEHEFDGNIFEDDFFKLYILIRGSSRRSIYNIFPVIGLNHSYFGYNAPGKIIKADFFFLLEDSVAYEVEFYVSKFDSKELYRLGNSRIGI